MGNVAAATCGHTCQDMGCGSTNCDVLCTDCRDAVMTSSVLQILNDEDVIGDIAQLRHCCFEARGGEEHDGETPSNADRMALAALGTLFQGEGHTGTDDQVVVVHRTETLVGTGGAADVLHWEDDFHVVDRDCLAKRWSEVPEGDAVEFRAHCVGPAGLRFSLFCNEHHAIAEGVALANAPRYFRFVGPLGLDIYSLTLRAEPAPSEDAVDPAVANACEPGMVLDSAVGLKIRGEDILHTLHMHGDHHVRARGQLHMPARGGHLAPSVTYHADNSVQFLAYGLSGSERLDLFVNGFSIPCQLGITLGDAAHPRLFRYYFSPMSCEINSIIMRVWDSESRPPACPLGRMPGHPAATPLQRPRFGVVVASSLGVLVGGHDCLRTARLIERGLCVTGDRTKSVQLGHWLWPGCYAMLPYRRKRRPPPGASRAPPSTAAKPGDDGGRDAFESNEEAAGPGL
mmetsp:Transcript_39250/g.113436  ORF Transcript_39250/g.113436 Transcript_39250/m.113436 type:complete len:457 (-) Transcript_39250:99-1469(-)